MISVIECHFNGVLRTLNLFIHIDSKKFRMFIFWGFLKLRFYLFLWKDFFFNEVFVVFSALALSVEKSLGDFNFSKLVEFGTFSLWRLSQTVCLIWFYPKVRLTFLIAFFVWLNCWRAMLLIEQKCAKTQKHFPSKFLG